MRGGDISNETPRRAVVTIDCIINKTPVLKKVFGILSYTQDQIEYDRLMLSRFWRYSSENGIILELVGFGYSVKEMQEFMDDLDNLGTNPFNYAKSYNVIADLVAELPYRNELMCVFDVPQRALRYGSWYQDLGRLP